MADINELALANGLLAIDFEERHAIVAHPCGRGGSFVGPRSEKDFGYDLPSNKK